MEDNKTTKPKGPTYFELKKQVRELNAALEGAKEAIAKKDMVIDKLSDRIDMLNSNLESAINQLEDEKKKGFWAKLFRK